MMSFLSILYKSLNLMCKMYIVPSLNRTRSDRSFMALIAGHDKNLCHALRSTCNENELQSSSIQTVLYIGDKLF